MSAVAEAEVDFEGDQARVQQLANARRKLKSFRAARTSDTPAPSASASSSRSSFAAPAPLTTDTTFNISLPPALPRLDYEITKGSKDEAVAQPPRSPGKLRKSRSRGSMSHRRQNSSISGNGMMRGSVMGLFESDQLEAKPMRGEPSHPSVPPVKPLLDAPTMEEDFPPEDTTAVKTRLTAFSFGAKPPANTRSPSPRARVGQPLLPSQLIPSEAFPSPNTSPVKRGSLSTPLSRPPSLLLTRPTPLAFGSPSPAGQARQLEPPSTPPTPARAKRHTHTRSSSISLPNLKLSSRPTSLGPPASPSFPSSPTSPQNLSRPNSIQGTRLKFEPSGRGAEAEKEKDEYRRRALEKLTGSPNPSPVIPDSPGHEIALPELDDEDGSSVASSARPFSGFGSFNFGRPNSSSSTPSGLSWTTSEDSPPMERWSTGFNAKVDDQDDGLGFGFTFPGSGSGSFSFGAAPSAYAPQEASIGMGLPSTMTARPSLTRNLSVLAEVDEPEDGEYDGANDAFASSPENASVPFSPNADELNHLPASTAVPIVAPTPSRLRELHLVSATSTTVSARPPSPSRSNSPAKAYGAIGRGRPAPINTDSPSSLNNITTPKSAGGPRRRPTSGSRGSSISYKKDCESNSSSRDWSMSSKAPFSPPTTFNELGSPPMQPAFAPAFGGWGSMSRSARPCPRPKSLAGLAFDNQGSGRILGEVEEVDEDGQSMRNPSSRIASSDVPNSAGLSDILHESFDDREFEWQSSHMELEMERDALQEDVDLWRKRCNGLEERLELEKKENGILRERVRKLGDRLSSIVSYPATRTDTSLVADLRTQLFGVKAELERERNEKLSAFDRIAELEAKLAASRLTPMSTPAPIITNVIPPTPMSPDTNISISSTAPTSPALTQSPNPEATAQRMRAWGFPREPSKGSQPRNRESFFGLSQILRRESTEDDRTTDLSGLDLPPIDLASAGIDPSAVRAVSDPTPLPTHITAAPLNPSETSHRSASITSSASSALSFFTGYLPNRAKSPSSTMSMSESMSSGRVPRHVTIQRLPTSEDKGNVDLRGGCKCCSGDVIEL